MVDGLMPTGSLLMAFCVASFVLAITPGPGVLYIVTRSIAQGRRSGVASVAGVALGNLGNAVGASIGLATLFAVSTMAFTLVKYAGAAYLIYLGIQALRSTKAADHALQSDAKPLRIFWDGLVVALFNPKTALFFSTFLPQFLSADAPTLPQSLMLGALFVAIAATTDTLYAVAAGSIAPWLANGRTSNTIARYLSGSTFIGLGLLTALGGSGKGSRHP